MARPLRIEFPDALYHVIARGNAGSLPNSGMTTIWHNRVPVVLSGRDQRGGTLEEACREMSLGGGTFPEKALSIPREENRIH